MTLIANELYLIDGFKDTFVVSYADRQLTYRNEKNPKKKYIKGRKLFKIEHLNSTVSFWGATLVMKERKTELLNSWLPNYIKKSSQHKTLLEFATNLRNELNLVMSKDQLKVEPSGFHLAGISSNGIPEFIHFSNCSHNPKIGGYDNILDHYKEPSQDFLSRDALQYGWDGQNKDSIKANGVILSYRNGNIIVHAVAWDNIDKIFAHLINQPNFSSLRKLTDHKLEKFIKQKLNFVGSIYSNWADTKLVAGPWDIELIRYKK
jgi:predicted secreted protein